MYKNKSMNITIRYIFTIILVALIMISLNYIFMASLIKYNPSKQPDKIIKAIAGEFNINASSLSLNSEAIIEKDNLWLQLVNPSGEVIYSKNVPENVQKHYSITDIAMLSKSYLKEYPVFVWKSNENLVILGYPKDSISKYNWSFYSKSFSFYFVSFIILNIVVTGLFANVLGRRLTKPLNNLIKGIFSLKEGKEISLKENGVYKDVVDSIHETSIAILEKNNAIKNWISGISHDVRTPLSMILGYSAIIEEDDNLPEETRLQAKIITENAVRFRELVANLNLATMLQYNMQPLDLSQVKLSNIARESMASCVNSGILKNCSSEVIIEEDIQVMIDKNLFERAIVNLIVNSVNHNSAGCHVKVIVPKINNKSEFVSICVEDDGCGISVEQQEWLRKKDFSHLAANEIHGLGFVIVKSIVAAHGGHVNIESKKEEGVKVTISIPKIRS